jgi:DNA-binding MurR/RpiR family transcriptional regulator
VQQDLVRQLRPAAERIRETGAGGLATHLSTELANVQATLDTVDESSMRRLTTRLADLTRPVRVLSGEATGGVAAQFVAQLHQLRPDVNVLIGSEVAVRRDIAVLPRSATVIVIDLRRYERWVLDAHDMLQEFGVWTAGVTDSMLSPIASRSAVTFIVSAGSQGPFDSHVGTLALLNLVAAGAAVDLRAFAADRLATVESAWRAHQTLRDGT